MKNYCVALIVTIRPNTKLSTLFMLFCFLTLIGPGICAKYRIQRRFMWNQMENSMGGLMGRMFHNARAMRKVIGVLMPSLSTTAASKTNMYEYLPTETTRIKYIIRDPHTNKAMKVIKMRESSKKVVKMPARQHATDHVISTKTHKIPKFSRFETSMRQLEKEKELIVEGKAPNSFDDVIDDDDVQQENYHEKKKGRSSNEVISGHILEYASWKPVYFQGDKPNDSQTSKPQILSQLHTDITKFDEFLPKPEKLVHNPATITEEVENKLTRQKGHTYEVTEHSVEGSESQEVMALKPIETLSGFLPSHGIYRHNQHQYQHQHHRHEERSRNKERKEYTTSSPTTTDEPPNYPASFLKKFKERTRDQKHQQNNGSHQKFKNNNINFMETNMPSTMNVNYTSTQGSMTQHRATQKPYNQTKIQKWPYDTEDYDRINPNRAVLSTSLKQSGEDPNNNGNESQNTQTEYVDDVPLSMLHHGNDYKKVKVRHRGSIKFFDKANYDESYL